MSEVLESFATKFASVLEQIDAEMGGVSLFALMLREDAGKWWDLVVGADWLDQNQREGLGYIADCLNQHLEPSELLDLSGIVPLDESNPFRIEMKKLYRVMGSKSSLEKCETR